MTKYTVRIYYSDKSAFFCKVKDQFGGFSNMSSEFPIQVNKIKIANTECLYQALRFSKHPELQEKILSTKNPMEAKEIAKKNLAKSKEDWETFRLTVMRWVLRVKLAQNFLKFGLLLESTHNKPIVELSFKDDFWGAFQSSNDKGVLIGTNALGRLLMELRDEYNSENRFKLLQVSSKPIENTLLFNKKIIDVDERNYFEKKFLLT